MKDTEFRNALDEIQAREARLATVVGEIEANDAQYGQYPSAQDAKAFYNLSLAPLFKAKQVLLAEQQTLKTRIETLRSETLAKLEAASLLPENKAIATREREEHAVDHERILRLQEEETDRSEWEPISLDETD